METFASIVEYAEKKNVKLAFENCPLMGNIAISPVMWREILKRLDSKMVGLAYDPSHLVWQFIDPYAPVAEFGDRINKRRAVEGVRDSDRFQLVELPDSGPWTSGLEKADRRTGKSGVSGNSQHRTRGSGLRGFAGTGGEWSDTWKRIFKGIYWKALRGEKQW